jgi:hypothetical protein
LPALTDRNGETVGNWTGVGTHSISADATHPYSGTKSLKILATSGGGFGVSYVRLPSANNTVFTVGKKYAVTVWTYTDSALEFRIQTGGVASGLLTTGSGVWLGIVFSFTAITAATNLDMCINTGGSIWFEMEQAAECTELNVLSERGMSDPDMFDFFPAIQNTFLDGSMNDQIKGFRRKILFDCGVVADRNDRLGILYFMIYSNRVVDYLTEFQVPLALQDISGFQNNWLFDCSLARQYIFALQEPLIRTTFPV